MPSAFGRLLRERRLGAWLTQEALAEAAGVAVRTVRSLERGTVERPQAASVRLLADALRLTGSERRAFLDAARGDQRSLTAVGWQLPADVPDFTGRAADLGRLREVLPAAPDAPVAVCVVHGQAGVGKTALAVHAAHGLRDAYPDGQVFLSLHGGDPAPADPAAVLERLLRLLRPPGTPVPPDPEDRAAAFRALLAGRRVLLVMDDAASAAQVRPLLPGSPGSDVLVTSRRPLLGLEGASRLGLEVLPAAEAELLLARVAGTDRVARDETAARLVVDRCGRLPLAIRIAGARLASGPGWSVGRLADLLADERRRLDELVAEDLEVRASLGLSYRQLRAEHRLAFRRLALPDVPEVPDWLVPTVLGGEAAAVEQLVDAQLVQRDPDRGLRLHSLVRAYARERAAAEDPPADHAALVRRTAEHCLALAAAADRRGWATAAERPLDCLPPGTAADADVPVPADLEAEPERWLDRALPAVAGILHQAAAAGDDANAAGLAIALVRYAEPRPFSGTLMTALEQGIRSARAAGWPRAESALLRARADRLTGLSELEAAATDLAAAERASLAAGDREGLAWTRFYLSAVEVNRGRLDAGLSHAEAAARLFTEVGRPEAAAHPLCVAGAAAVELGAPEQAMPALHRALTLVAPDEVRTEANVRMWIAEASRAAGRPVEGIPMARQAVELCRRVGDRYAQAATLISLSKVLIAAGRPDDALAAAREALDYATAVGDRKNRAIALRLLARLGLPTGDAAGAVAAAEESVDILAELGNAVGESRSLVILGDARKAAGDLPGAEAAWRRATSLSTLDEIRTAVADRLG